MLYVQLKKAFYGTLQANGSYYPAHHRSGDSKLMTMTDAWQIRQSIAM